MYDWANSAFILTVVAGFFPVFFKTYWSASVDPTVSTARLGLGNAIAGGVVAIISPLLGAVADIGRAKKRLLGSFMLLGAISTVGLFFIPQGGWIGALCFFLVASVGFNSANIFYDSLLVDVASAERMDWVSSVGYATGYLGCGLLFAFNVLMVTAPERFALPGQAEAIRVSFLVAALWWLLFSVPLLLFVHERGEAERGSIVKAIRGSVGSVMATLRVILRNRALSLFLVAYWLYIDGVHTFVLMAVDFGMAIGLESSSLMVALLVVQFVAFPSALLFGIAAKRLSAAVMILAGIMIYICVCVFGVMFLRTSLDYIILAGITGVAQGGIQALSRSWFGRLIPVESSAEYFGFFNIVNRFAVIAGPAVVGSVAFFSKRAGVESVWASRLGMSSVSLLFVCGGIFLFAAEQSRKRQLA